MPVELTLPTISAVIPLYNGARFIETALRSVFVQTLPPKEIVVVDDGSADDGPEIVERIKGTRLVTLLRKQNDGQSSARNFGVKHSTGDLIAFLDQDDVWYPNHLEELAKPFLEERQIPLGWAYSNLDLTDGSGRITQANHLDRAGSRHPKRSILQCLSEDMHILPSASLISREAFDRADGFDERLSGYEDDDLFLRLFRLGYQNVYINQSLSQWRQHDSNAGRSPRMMRSAAIYLDKLLDHFPLCIGAICPRFLHGGWSLYKHGIDVGREGVADDFIDLLEAIKSRSPIHIKFAIGIAAAIAKYPSLVRLVRFAGRPTYSSVRRLASALRLGV